MKIEYRVREVARYIVTKYREEDDGSAGVGTCGEYDNYDMAYAVGYALARSDAERFDVPPGDTRVMYPEPRGTKSATVQ